MDDAFHGTYAWGSAPVAVHRGFIRSYPAILHRAKLPPPWRGTQPKKAAAPGLNEFLGPVLNAGSAAVTAIGAAHRLGSDALHEARQVVSGYVNAYGTEVASYVRRIPGAAARGVEMGELADNLAAFGMIADLSISLLAERYRYRDMRGWKAQAGEVVSIAADVTIPTALGLLGGTVGAATLGIAGGEAGSAVEPGGGTIVGVLEGVSIGYVTGVGVGAAVGGVLAEGADELLFNALGGNNG